MKQTAVEFLLEKYKSQNTLLFGQDFEQAKEMEKKQAERMKVVEDILIEYVKTNPTKPYRVVKWFEQFKKK
jgi:hypothetical protein